MRLTRLLLFSLFGLLAAGALHAQSSTTATILRPYITSISPESLDTGVDSTVVTINGRRFQRGAEVFFNARKLTKTRLEGDSVIVAVIPGELTNYPDVAVLMIENPDETKIGLRVKIFDSCTPRPALDRFADFYIAQPVSTSATMQAFTLRIGNAGSPGFTLKTRVDFNGVPLAIDLRSTSATFLLAEVPAYLNVPGAYFVSVHWEGGCTRIRPFTITPALDPASAPAITRVNPSMLTSNGGNITITGVNFSTLATVRLGSTTLAIVSISATRIVAVVPPNLSRLNFTLSVTNPDGQAASQSFAYISVPKDLQLAPTIIRLTPSTVCKNTQTDIKITGENFVEGARVLLGPIPLAIISSSTSQIVARVPADIPLANYLLSVINPDGQAVGQVLAFTCVGVSIALSINSIYPNPATTALTLETTLDRAATLTLTLRNVMGASVLEERHTAATGRFATTLDVSALASGVYVLEVSDGVGRWVQKVVKY